jgi:hypothetical protein
MSVAVHVVGRCPSCGVEHESGGGDCEACGTPLRSWCRRHGRDVGWLAVSACPRCDEEAARPLAAPRARVAPSAAPPPATPERPSSWPGGRSPREILRGAAREPPPEPAPKDVQDLSYEVGGALGLGCVGWIAGMFLGVLASVVTGADVLLTGRIGGLLFGLAGLMVGIIHILARRPGRWEK